MLLQGGWDLRQGLKIDSTHFSFHVIQSFKTGLSFLNGADRSYSAGCLTIGVDSAPHKLQEKITLTHFYPCNFIANRIAYIDLTLDADTPGSTTESYVGPDAKTALGTYRTTSKRS